MKFETFPMAWDLRRCRPDCRNCSPRGCTTAKERFLDANEFLSRYHGPPEEAKLAWAVHRLEKQTADAINKQLQRLKPGQTLTVEVVWQPQITYPKTDDPQQLLDLCVFNKFTLNPGIQLLDAVNLCMAELKDRLPKGFEPKIYRPGLKAG